MAGERRHPQATREDRWISWRFAWWFLFTGLFAVVDRQLHHSWGRAWDSIGRGVVGASAVFLAVSIWLRRRRGT